MRQQFLFFQGDACSSLRKPVFARAISALHTCAHYRPLWTLTEAVTLRWTCCLYRRLYQCGLKSDLCLTADWPIHSLLRQHILLAHLQHSLTGNLPDCFVDTARIEGLAHAGPEQAIRVS